MHQRRPVSSREVIPSEPAISKYRVAADQCFFPVVQEADTPRRMTRGVDDPEVPDTIAIRQESSRDETGRTGTEMEGKTPGVISQARCIKGMDTDSGVTEMVDLL
jgi:hypothetical protein